MYQSNKLPAQTGMIRLQKQGSICSGKVGALWSGKRGSVYSGKVGSVSPEFPAWPQNTIIDKLHYNMYCSKLTASTPGLISSGQGIDLILNGIVDISNPPNSPNNLVFEAKRNLIVADDQEKFVISSGGVATFKAGTTGYIHVKPGSNTANDFGAKNGSLTHLFLQDPEGCTIPFRLADPNRTNKENINEDGEILSAYPNPFYADFNLRYSVLDGERITIELYDSYNRKIRSLISEYVTEAGLYSMNVDLYNLESGVYFVLLTSNLNKRLVKIVKL